MTNQLPPPPLPLPAVQDIDLKHLSYVPLAHTIKDLHDLIFNISLPKTEKAKTVKVPTHTLHLLHELATSTFTYSSTQGPPLLISETSRLDILDRQLADTQALLATP